MRFGNHFKLLIPLGAAMLPGFGPSAWGQTPPPNIVLIMADDLGYECIGANGGASYTTPHLDRLAAGGLRFTQCHSQPLCTPSRVQIMTGQYNVRNYTHFGHIDPSQRTFAHDLRDRGYATAISGKWQLGGDRQAIGRFGFDEYCLWWLEKKSWRYGSVGELIRNGDVLPGSRGEYGPDVVNRFVLDFIERHRTGPFFVYYPMMLPHAPFVPTPLSQGGAEPREQDPQYFADMVSYMDLLVGRVVEKLEALGLREKTLLIFTGDNGTNSDVRSALVDGTVVQGGKGRTTGAGTRVPLIVSWPGTVPAGLVSERLVDFSDFVPTLQAAAGYVPSRDRVLDGVDLMPVFKGERPTTRQWSYCWYAKEGEEDKISVFARDARFKLYADGRFIDLPRDSLEMRPLPVSSMEAGAMESRRRLQAVIDRFAPLRPVR